MTACSIPSPASARLDSRRASGPCPRQFTALPLLVVLVLLAALQSSSWAQPSRQQNATFDPPGRVARLNLAEGAVSFAPGDADRPNDASAWTPAQLNRPLTSGDRLWTGPRARSELHIGSTAVRMHEATSLDFSALDDSLTQLRLAQGTVRLRVRTLFEGQRLEVDTPNLAFVISQPGDYRLDVDPASGTTRVVAQSGSGVLYGDSGVPLTLGSGQQGTFSGTQLASAAPGAAVQDRFDGWARARDQREDESVSARYIPRETIGYQQLDSYGDWKQDPAYGAVWLPRAVPVNWAPYRAGHWSWISPWGWTWVDDAPWGFAPFHYGRWAQIGPRWAWVPGQLPQRPVYAPALVAFVGGGNGGGVNWNIAIGSGGAPRPALGWFPLAPGEAFRPAYRASPRYVNQVNNNIVVNNTVNVTNIYRYQRQPAAVTATSREDFARGRPVRGNLQAVRAIDLNRTQVVREPSALPQRLERPDDRRERSRLAPAALPPAAVAAQAVVRSRGEHGNDRRAEPNRSDERRNDPRAARVEGGERMPKALLTMPAAPAAPAAIGAQPVQPPAVRPAVVERGNDRPAGPNRPDERRHDPRAARFEGGERTPPRVQPPLPIAPVAPAAVGAVAVQPPAVRPALAPAPVPASRRNAPEAEQQQRAQDRQQEQLQRDKQRQQTESTRQQDQQRRQNDAAQGQQRAMQQQAQQQQQQLQRDQQRQQAQIARQQDQQRRQSEAALAQQRPVQGQPQPQRAVPNEPQRKPHEPPQQQPDQRVQQGAENHPARPADKGKPHGPRPEGETQRNREP